MSEQTDLRETVRARYAAATAVTQGCVAEDCCGPQSVNVDENFGSTLYTPPSVNDLVARLRSLAV